MRLVSADKHEFIHLAQRWGFLYKRIINTLARLPEEVYQFALQKILFMQAKVKPSK